MDSDARGEALGIELLNVSQGVNTAGWPSREIVERCLDDHQIRQYA